MMKNSQLTLKTQMWKYVFCVVKHFVGINLSPQVWQNVPLMSTAKWRDETIEGWNDKRG